MKKLLSIIMILNFAPMIVCSEKDSNADNDLLKKAAYETLTDTAYAAVYLTACTIRAAIPFATIASLTNDAKKTNDKEELRNIQNARFGPTILKSIVAIPCAMAYTTAEPAIAVFFGAHALSLICVHIADKFIDAKLERLKKEENKKRTGDQITGG